MTSNTVLKSGHDIRYLTHAHGAGCFGYYTRSGEPPRTWMGKGAVALSLSGRVDPGEAERLYQEGIAPGGERIWKARGGKDPVAAEEQAVAAWLVKHPYASATEIDQARSQARSRNRGLRFRTTTR